MTHWNGGPFIGSGSMGGGGLMIPVGLWGSRAPTHRIRTLSILPNRRILVTGTMDGHICIWHRSNQKTSFVPKQMVFLTESPVVGLAPAGVDMDTTCFVSSSRNGWTCLWDSMDGHCVESVSGSNVHTVIKPHIIKLHGGLNQLRLFCSGRYPEIMVMDPRSLQILFSLASRVEPDWITAFAILKPAQKHDIVVGLSTAGMVKIWSLIDIETRDRSNALFEDESKQIRCQEALSIDPCPFNQRAMMVVASYAWQVFDASDFSSLVSCAAPSSQSWLGGAFINIDKVMAWASDGRAYLYQLPRNSILGSSASSAPPFDKTVCFCVLRLSNHDESRTLNTEPSFRHIRSGGEGDNEWVIRGDSAGRIFLWEVPQVPDKAIAALQQENFATYPELFPTQSFGLEKAWDNLPLQPSSIIGHLPDGGGEITTTLYVATQGRLILGRKDGSIVLVSAAQTLMRQLLQNSSNQKSGSEWPSTRVLRGHCGAVTCVSYPHEEHPRYDPSLLVSGGADFSIFLWDLSSGSRLHRFCVQAGPVLRLIVPPYNCNPRILQCVCSVAADHSVALLGVKEQKCVLLASRHLFPVREVFWRPLDDFLLVQCHDSTVYVWQMETGHLDRIVSGMLAEEVIMGCEEQVGVGGEGEEEVSGTSISVQMFRAIRHKNVAAIKKIAGGGEDRGESGGRNMGLAPPMTVQGLKTHKDDPDSHIVLLNIEALIMGLLLEENSATLSNSSSDASFTSERNRNLSGGAESPSLSGFLARAKDKAESLVKSSPVPQRRSGEDKVKDIAGAIMGGHDLTVVMEVAKLAMSLLHGWGLDRDLDKVCVGKLGLRPPAVPLCFGLVSRHGFLSLLLPPALNPDHDELPTTGPGRGEKVMKWFSALHWRLSPTLTTQHLLAVVASANTLMSMSSAGFLPDQERKRKIVKRMSAQQGHHVPQEMAEALTTEQSQIKQGWSLLAALHCVLLPELVHKPSYQPPRIELLARRWQERCLELREAAQALLLRELNRLGSKGRKALIDEWSPFLPTLLDPSLSIFGHRLIGSHPSAPNQTPRPHSPHPGANPLLGVSEETGSSSGVTASTGGPNFEPLLAASDAVSSVMAKSGGVAVDNSLQTIRRNQATAVVVLGVIGAEFGQEIVQHSRVPTTAPAGFTDKDYSLARATSQSLLELLIQPPSPLLPPHSPLRRAAIDLLGRGFVVWQPYLDISKVLLGLLELCANSDKLIPNPPLIFPLSPQADACRTAKHALGLVATARPPAFLTALSKEVARFNASTQHSTLQPGSSPLLKSRLEVLRMVEMLTEKHYNDMVDLMPPVGEILVHCLDTSLLKSQSLQEIFPPITKFYMVCYCPHTRRIAFGSRMGIVVMHELRAGKAQTIHAHSKPVTACSFSEDGKHLATYSADEGKINFWQTSQSFLGMGQSQVKCVRQVPAPPAFPVTTPGGTGTIFRARLVWVGPKALTLLLPNGKEHRFTL